MRKTKYLVKVHEAKRAMKVDKEVEEAVKGALGRKMIRKMKREYVECPVANRKVSFLECFTCISFIRRIRGVVHCSSEGFSRKL